MPRRDGFPLGRLFTAVRQAKTHPHGHPRDAGFIISGIFDLSFRDVAGIGTKYIDQSSDERVDAVIVSRANAVCSFLFLHQATPRPASDADTAPPPLNIIAGLQTVNDVFCTSELGWSQCR